MKILKFKLGNKFYVEHATDLYIIDLHHKTEQKFNLFTQKASRILRDKQHYKQATVEQFIKQLHKAKYELSQTLIDILKLKTIIKYQVL